VYGPSSATQISSFTNIPKNKIYEILTALEENGFILKQPGTPALYKAMDPKDVISKIVEGKKVDLDTIKLNIFKEIDRLDKVKTRPEDSLFWVMSSRKAYFTLLKKELLKAKQEIDILTNSIGLSKMRDFECQEGIHETIKEYVRHRLLVADVNFDRNKISKFKKEGYEIQTINKILPHFLIIDDFAIFILLQPGETEFPKTDLKEFELFSNNKYFIQVMKSFFSLCWELSS
jgi:sugar-specific transcriptional regulator TrmB